MKTEFNKFILLVLVTMSLISSCKDSFLELKPYTQTPADEALLSETDALNVLRGAYAGLRSINLYGRTIPVIGDLSADNIFISLKNTSRYIAFDQYVITKNNTDYRDMWSNAYVVILRANAVINAPLPATEIMNQYRGEAYAIRALMYFELLRNFAKPFSDDPNGPGVPIIVEFNPLLKPARNTVKEVYDQIFSDLDNSYSLQTVPLYSGSARFSKYAARALAAKVSLYAEKYQQALDYSNEVITNSKFTLVGRRELLEYWANPASNSSSSMLETLFEVSSDAVSNSGNEELGYIYSQSGYGDLLANETLYALYKNRDKDQENDSSDIRKSLILVGKRVGGENPAYIVNKYKNISGDRDDKKVLRISEVYLIASEAANRLNDDVQARARLNALVAQRDPFLSYSSSGAQLLEDILLERRKELAFEGDRFYDFNRLKRNIVRVGGRYSVRNIPYSNNLRFGPIPQVERDANPNIDQNPGY